MKEEEKRQPSERGLDEKRKTALLRYVAILFAVAFLMVLFSMLAQMRDSKQTISQLNQSSASAAQKAEQLQNNYLELQNTNEMLHAQVEALEAELETLRANQKDEDIVKAIDILKQEAKTAKGKTQEAYDALLTALEHVTPGSQEGNVALSKALETVKTLETYLGEKGLEVYHSLTKGE